MMFNVENLDMKRITPPKPESAQRVSVRLLNYFGADTSQTSISPLPLTFTIPGDSQMNWCLMRS